MARSGWWITAPPKTHQPRLEARLLNSILFNMLRIARIGRVSAFVDASATSS
jgi:hypothetical protein